MAQSVRERINELGVLKTLGFGDGRVLSLVLLESCTIALVGGGLGLLLSWTFITIVGDPTGGFLPIFHFPPRDLIFGALLVFALGLGEWHGPGVPGEPAQDRRRAPPELIDADHADHADRTRFRSCNGSRRPVAVTTVTLRSISQRLGSSIVAVIGIAGVVVVFISVLSIAAGLSPRR